MKWTWRDARTETCSMFYLESEEEGCILEVTAVTAEDNPDLNLIASAPELLEACQHVADNLRQESPEVWEHEIAHLEEAINKARGV